MIHATYAFCALFLASEFVLTKSAVDLQCIPLRECPKLLNLMKKSPTSPSTIDILRTAQCGFEGDHPKVWCAQIITTVCKTPDGELGKCIPVKECEPFLKLVKTPIGRFRDVIPYLQQFQCKEPYPDASSIAICCPTELKSLLTKQPNTQLPSPLPLLVTELEESDTEVYPRPSFLPRPTEGECGLQLTNRIVGGKVTEMDEFPWTALLEYHLRASVKTACAGSLISKRYVVTAAHCVDSNAIRAVGKLTNVILGEFDTRTDRDCINTLGIEDCADPPLKVPVENIILHHQWYSKPRAHLNHDIALVRLAESVRFTDYIKPICLPSSTLTIKEKEKLIVTGWGQTETGGSSFVKLKTTVPMANRQQCVQKYIDDKKLVVGDGAICVGGEEGKDSCSGDSGGPLMFSVDREGLGIWFLVGVVSFGSNQPCGIKDYPALYTYIPNYTDWIYRTVEP